MAEAYLSLSLNQFIWKLEEMNHEEGYKEITLAHLLRKKICKRK